MGNKRLYYLIQKWNHFDQNLMISRNEKLISKLEISWYRAYLHRNSITNAVWCDSLGSSTADDTATSGNAEVTSAYDARTSYIKKQYHKTYKDLVDHGLLFFSVTAMAIVLGMVDSFFTDKGFAFGFLQIHNAIGFSSFLIAKIFTGRSFGRFCFTLGMCEFVGFVFTALTHQYHNMELVVSTLSIVIVGGLCAWALLRQDKMISYMLANRPPGPDADYDEETFSIMKKHDQLYKEMCDQTLTFFSVTALAVVVGLMKSDLTTQAEVKSDFPQEQFSSYFTQNELTIWFLQVYNAIGLIAILLAKIFSSSIVGMICLVIAESLYAAFVLTAIAHKVFEIELLVLSVAMIAIGVGLSSVFVKQSEEMAERENNHPAKLAQQQEHEHAA